MKLGVYNTNNLLYYCTILKVAKLITKESTGLVFYENSLDHIVLQLYTHMVQSMTACSFFQWHKIYSPWFSCLKKYSPYNIIVCGE